MPQYPHLALGTESNRSHHTPPARQNSGPNTGFDSPTTTSPNSTPMSVDPEVTSSGQPHASSSPRSSRFFHRFGFSLAKNPSEQGDNPLRRTIDGDQRKQKRAESRERARSHKLAKKEAIQEERARTQWLGGLAWGFDPEAGQSLRNTNGTDCAVDGRGRRKERRAEIESGRPRQVGIEAGGPGNEGRFGYGLLKTRDAELFAPGKPGGLQLQSVGSERRRKTSSSSPY